VLNTDASGTTSSIGSGTALTCRLCGTTDLRSFCDLGATPPCELFLTEQTAQQPEQTFPLHVRVCNSCLLAQLPPEISPEETFEEYAYFSSFSSSWVDHARRFVDSAQERAGLDTGSFVVEVASNDGYLLQHVVAKGIRCLGVEPSVNVGEAAREKGVPTLTAFLTPETGARVRAEHGPADLVCGNNVFAHIPDVVGFAQGLRAMVADDGWVSIEVQHLLTLVERKQFDTIYHEHFQYYTLLTGQRALAAGGLTLVDVELLDTHGGSIRMWARPADVAGEPSAKVREVLDAEAAAGLHTPEGHDGFGGRLHHPRRPGVVPHRRPPAGEARGRLRRPGQGEHAAQLLRHPARPARVHGGPEPVQARAADAGHPNPDLRSGADRAGPPRPRVDPALEPAHRADRAAVLRPRVGRHAGLPDPVARGGLT